MTENTERTSQMYDVMYMQVMMCTIKRTSVKASICGAIYDSSSLKKIKNENNIKS